MPGTSRMPVSLRESFNNVRNKARARPVWSNPLQLLSLDLYVFPYTLPIGSLQNKNIHN
jgi:hypothetical protein